jgi:Holliday junction resolvasome RuvABC endonuclease subunit
MPKYILGVDPSSTICGVSIVNASDGEVIEFSHHVSNKKLDLGERVWKFAKYLDKFRAKRKIIAVGIEEDSVSRNLNTVRKISYFESVALLKAGQWGATSLLIKPSTARKLTLGKGNGNLKKDQVFDMMSNEYKFTDGKAGLDECDAVVIGIAAQKLYDKK